jgi:hypothetical protein
MSYFNNNKQYTNYGSGSAKRAQAPREARIRVSAELQMARRRPRVITELNRIRLVLFKMNNGIFGPCLAAVNRILISVSHGCEAQALTFTARRLCCRSLRRRSPGASATSYFRPFTTSARSCLTAERPFPGRRSSRCSSGEARPRVRRRSDHEPGS